MDIICHGQKDIIMNRNELIHNLKGGTVSVIFKKVGVGRVEGGLRKMLCTLQEDVIPKTTGKKKENKEVLVVWDLEKKDWRSFRIDSIKKVTLRTEHTHK